MSDDLLWVQAIEEYCNKNNCMPSDLIVAHQGGVNVPTGLPDGKESKFKKVKKRESTTLEGETYFEKRQREKNNITKEVT